MRTKKLILFYWCHVILFSFLFFLTSNSHADVKVESTVDNNEIGLGDTLTLSLSVTSSEDVDISEPRLPDIDGFHLMNSWSSSSTSSKLTRGSGGMQFETVRRRDFNYALSPQKEGSLQIPAAEVTVGGKVYHTQPIIIKVSKEGSAQPKSTRKNINPFGGLNPGFDEPDFDSIDEADRMFQQMLQNRGVKPPANDFKPANPKELFFVRLELDKKSAYVGEQLTANWYIYTRANILSLDRLKFPDLRGFWKEIIEEIPVLQFESEVLNGIQYKRALLASHALFPIKAGIAVIDEYKVKASVQSPGAFGFGQAYTYTRSSERVKIDVKPLPSVGQPSNFTGAVGKFEVQTSIEGKSFPVNQPFSLKIRFDGEGNAKTIDLPKLELPEGLELYDTKNESKFFKNGHSYKEFEVLIIPRREGEFKIPALSFGLFNPQTGQYYQKSSSELAVNVTPSNVENVKDQGLSQGFLQGQTVEQNPKRLPGLLLNPDEVKAAQTKGINYFILFVWIGAFSILGYFFKKEVLTRPQEKNINEEIQKRIKKINNYISASDYRKVGVEGTNLIYYVLGKISGLGGAQHEIEKILELAPPSVRSLLGEKLKKHIQVFQILGFAPDEVVGIYKSKDKMNEEVTELEKTLQTAAQLKA